MNTSLIYDDGLAITSSKHTAPCKSSTGMNLNDYEFSDWFQYGKCIFTEGVGIYKGYRVVKGKRNQVIKVDSTVSNNSIMGVGRIKLEKLNTNICKPVIVDCSGSEPVYDWIPFSESISRVHDGRILSLKEARALHAKWDSMV